MRLAKGVRRVAQQVLFPDETLLKALLPQVSSSSNHFLLPSFLKLAYASREHLSMTSVRRFGDASTM
ncbi:MAG TPA: hypothetical protein VFV38_39360, partial [Ktedonobacteraceae bacterium]|nr:hypothetical protein [Ktedonobacteraceae bacterium]